MSTPAEGMTDEQIEALLEELEAGFREEVQAALTLTANDFAAAVEDATELVAAAFSVSRIANMWRRRVGGLVTKLRGIARRGARVAAEDLGEPVPTAEDMAPVLDPYMEATEQLLNAVGARLAAEATQSLAEGVAAGESLDELKSRMITLFNDTGTQLGPTRAERIAMTETTRAFNAGTLASAQALTGPERPLVKQWITRNDEKVRQAHRDANGQLQLLDDPFDVGGTPMQYPGDPTAPAGLTINCRCIMRASAAPIERTASMDQDDDLSAASGEHTGAMIALMPTAEDAARMALIGGEAEDQLHLTLSYLGKAADWDDQMRANLMTTVQHAAGWLSPVDARAFGVAQWNPFSESPVWVWNVGDDQDAYGASSTLREAHQEVSWQLEDLGYDLPVQHSPWSPHMAAVYGDVSDVGDMADLVDRVGPVSFDRIRVAFAGEYTDFPLVPRQEELYEEECPEADYELTEPAPEFTSILTWSTPGATALAFENQQTGDGRVFAPGALYWNEGPWPLQYADEMMGGHDGAQLAGAIHSLGREGDRIPGAGVLYLTQQAGAEAAMLLSQGAPLGVSVDLDDVDIEMVDATPGAIEAYHTKLVTASLLPQADGGWWLTGETVPELAASGTGTMIESRKVSFIVSAEGTVPGGLLDLVAAAGDPDAPEGVVIDSQRSGEFLVRITRGRVRGATLVTIPAYADARIVLDDTSMFASAATVTAGAATSDYDRVVRQVRKSFNPATASDVAKFLKIPIVAVRRYLARAAKKGDLVRLTRGSYVAPSQDATVTASVATDVADGLNELAASVTGAVDLPVASRDTEWDGDKAATRVFEWADGDADKIARAFAYRDDDKDPLTKAAYKLGYADVLDGDGLVIIPAGVSAALGALHGARGGVDLPEADREGVAAKLDAVAAHVSEETGEDEMNDMMASAWSALADLPPMPAGWFAEPTAEELPPGGPGVNYANGRIFGWVAQAGEAHAGYAKKITIDALGKIDTQHFLRQRFTLDDGSVVKAGAYTMNVGHHRDGAECETASCQFDDSRTVAGIVTVGMNERGMWFSGAAAPWLSEWDRRVFMGTQPSYHMKKGPSGNWQLRAVLSVPVPGHSSPLLASAVIERTQLALTAAATMAEVDAAVATEEAVQASIGAVPEAEAVIEVAVPELDYDRLADAIVAASARAESLKAAEEAELAELLAEAAKLDQ